MVAETKDNKFDYTQLHHLTDEETVEVEGGFAITSALVLTGISIFGTGLAAGQSIGQIIKGFNRR